VQSAAEKSAIPVNKLNLRFVLYVHPVMWSFHTTVSVQGNPCTVHGVPNFLPVTRFEEPELDAAIDHMLMLESDPCSMSVL
jgi:hypothetical protein